MVEVHDYSQDSDQKNLAEQNGQPYQIRENVDEQHAFWVGISVLIVFIVVLVFVIGVWINGRNNEKKTQTTDKSASNIAGLQTENLSETPRQEISTDKQKTINNPAIQPESSNTTSAATIEEILMQNPGSYEYTVQPGDTLFSIGQNKDIDWKKIAEINKLQKPYTLHSGQKIAIPPK